MGKTLGWYIQQETPEFVSKRLGAEYMSEIKATAERHGTDWVAVLRLRGMGYDNAQKAGRLDEYKRIVLGAS